MVVGLYRGRESTGAFTREAESISSGSAIGLTPLSTLDKAPSRVRDGGWYLGEFWLGMFGGTWSR